MFRLAGLILFSDQRTLLNFWTVFSFLDQRTFFFPFFFQISGPFSKFGLVGLFLKFVLADSIFRSNGPYFKFKLAGPKLYENRYIQTLSKVTSPFDLSFRGRRKVKFSTLSDFKGYGVKLFRLEPAIRSVNGRTFLSNLSLTGQSSNFKLCPIPKVQVSNCLS